MTRQTRYRPTITHLGSRKALGWQPTLATDFRPLSYWPDNTIARPFTTMT